MQRRNQQMAIAVDEHGLVGGIITVEDLVEEIVGEMGRESTRAPDVVREPDGSMMLRGSVAVGKLQELFGVELADAANAAATTVAGFLNSIAGHVPRHGEQMEHDGLHFEVVEANQRKVLRLRVRRVKPPPRLPDRRPRSFREQPDPGPMRPTEPCARSASGVAAFSGTRREFVGHRKIAPHPFDGPNNRGLNLPITNSALSASSSVPWSRFSSASPAHRCPCLRCGRF